MTTTTASAVVITRRSAKSRRTPHAGGVHDLNETYSAYASYIEIFKPQIEMDSSRSVLKPMTTRPLHIV